MMKLVLVFLTLSAVSTALRGQSSPISYRFGGNLLRDPASTPADHDFCHVAQGAGDAGTPVAAEDKNTIDSTSDFVLHGVPSTTGDLRRTRSNDVVSMWHRVDETQPWVLLRQLLRPDLLQTLLVGLMVYSAPVSPDVRARFEWGRFAVVP